jgi:hypothetical protein
MTDRGTRRFGAITIDTTRWPVILWESPPHQVADSEAAEALAWLEELWRSTPAGSKSFTLTDLSGLKEAAPARQRKYAADFVKRNRELQLRASVGGAIVATSAFVRGMLTAVFWLQKTDLEARMVATRDEGLLYGIELLSGAGQPLPAELLTLRSKHPRGT